jgi:hypothetical protein
MLLNRFLGNSEGAVAVFAALTLVPVVAAVGAAVDLGRATSARAAMQAALDSSVLAMAKDSRRLAAADLSESAKDQFKALFQNGEVKNLQITASATATSTGYTTAMSAKGTMKTRLMSIVGISAVEVAVDATAVSFMDGLGCVLSLHPQLSGAVDSPGSASVNLSGCSLYDNSEHATALTVGGSAQITALSVGVVGNLTGAANITTTNGIRTRMAPVEDPYAADVFPAFGGCSKNNLIVHGVTTLVPGVYCGGMKINAGAEVTLSPGIYYIDGGDLTVNGGASLSGSGVTLVFTSQNRNGYANALFNGGANISLSPPKSGPTAGIVMFGDRNMPEGTTFKLNGGMSQYLAGAVYLPKGAIEFAGGASTSTSCTQLIGSTVAFTGNSKLVLDCSSYGTKPFSARIVKLTS